MLHKRFAARILIIALFILSASACSGTRPAFLGTVQTNITPCPETPNCISSHANEDQSHAISAIKLSDTNKAHAALIELLEDNSAANIIVNSENYIYAEFTSAMIRFVDDVEFLFKHTENAIDVRSASRIGRSDFGVNRERIETIRQQLSSTEQ